MQTWDIWANTDDRKIQLLRSGCAFAIQQVQTWGDWANTEQRVDLVLQSECRVAIKQLENSSTHRPLRSLLNAVSFFRDDNRLSEESNMSVNKNNLVAFCSSQT